MGAIWVVLHLLFQRVSSFISLGAIDSVLGAQKAAPSKLSPRGRRRQKQGPPGQCAQVSLKPQPGFHSHLLRILAPDGGKGLNLSEPRKMSIMNAGLRCGLNVMIQTSCLEHKESMGAVGEGEASQFVIFLPVTV